MIISIVVLMLIVAVVALVANILTNLARIEEMKELRKELARFENAFRHDYRVRAFMKQKKEDDVVTLIVKEETNDLPKFGDE